MITPLRRELLILRPCIESSSGRSHLRNCDEFHVRLESDGHSCCVYDVRVFLLWLQWTRHGWLVPAEYHLQCLGFGVVYKILFVNELLNDLCSPLWRSEHFLVCKVCVRALLFIDMNAPHSTTQTVSRASRHSFPSTQTRIRIGLLLLSMLLAALAAALVSLPYDPKRTNGGFSYALELAKNQPGAVIDVGANGGAEAHIGSRAGRLVFSFECLASAYNELVGNPTFRALPNVTLVHACAGAEPKLTVLHHAQDSSSLNIENTAHDRELKKSRREHVHTEAVLVQPLDAYFLGDAAMSSVASRVALIKVDTQGTEASVLRGLRGVIARDRPVIMYEDMRKHTAFNYKWFKNDGDPKELLEPMGYSCEVRAVEFFCLAPRAQA